VTSTIGYLSAISMAQIPQLLVGSMHSVNGAPQPDNYAFQFGPGVSIARPTRGQPVGLWASSPGRAFW